MVERINVPSHNSGILDQIKSFYFIMKAIKITKNNEYDLIVATYLDYFSFLGQELGRKIPLYLDIRDLFVDTVPNVLSSITT